MKETLPLFPHAHARREDPETSKAAARSLTPQALGKQQALVLGFFEEYGPMADTQLVSAVYRAGITASPSGLRSRRAELVAIGKLKDSGRRLLGPSGRLHTIWSLAEKVDPS